MQNRKYRGVDMFVLTGPSQFAVPFTYTLHKDWLVVGLFPQAVKGSILRCEGKHKTWQAPAYLGDILAKTKKEGGPKTKLVGATTIDPRPTFEIGLALLPTVAHFLGRFGNTPFDVDKIPNAQALNEFLYPAVSLFYDDDTALRWESHFAVDAPVDSLFFMPFFGVFGFFF